MKLSKKQRSALPAGIPASAHAKLLEKFGYLGLFHLVHPDGDREKVDPMRQLSDCQTNLIAQKDLFEAFQQKFVAGDDRTRILQLLADFARDHANDCGLNDLRNMDDVMGDIPWNEDLVRICNEFEKANPTTYRINQLGYTLNADVALFRDVGGAIANWTILYTHPVYLDGEESKPKEKVTLSHCRPYLKKEASELARKYSNDRLLECTSEKYRKTPEHARLLPWPNVAEQVHALIGRVVSTVEQKGGPSIEVGSLFLEVAAWLIVNLSDGHPIVFNIRRRAMTTPATNAQDPTNGDDDFEDEDQANKLYRTTSVLTLLAFPNKERTDYVFYDHWPEEYGDIVCGFADCISYYDVDQKGAGLDSADDRVFAKAVMNASPFLLMLPMLAGHKPHAGMAQSNDPQYDLYKKVCRPFQRLNVSRTTFEGLTLAATNDNPAPNQATIYDWAMYGSLLAFQHNQADTREYTFPVKNRCMVLRKDPIDVSLRHLHMSSPNEAHRKAQAILALQKQADETGAVVGRYACRIKNLVLNTVTQESGDRISSINHSNARLKAYKQALPANHAFYEIAK